MVERVNFFLREGLVSEYTVVRAASVGRAGAGEVIMRFHVEGSDQHEGLTLLRGYATNDIADPAREFCRAYSTAVRCLIQPDSLILEPCFWADPLEKREGVDRTLFDDEQPGIVQAVFECIGAEPGPFDVIVMMYDTMLSCPTGLPHVIPVVIQDAATIMTEEFTHQIADLLSWAGPILFRLAIAAKMTRSAEQLLGDAAVRDAAYLELKSAALADLLRGRYGGKTNGEALFVRENPGLVSLIERIVQDAREEEPVSMPFDVEAVGESAVESFHAAVGASYVKISKAA